MRKRTLARLLGERQAGLVQDALKLHLRLAERKRIGERIGRTPRFFENARYRGTMQLADFFATCAALELDPIEFAAAALAEVEQPEIRQPRIVKAAWQQIHTRGTGLGEPRLRELETSLREEPRATRQTLSSELLRAAREEVPLVLGLYGSALRVEAELSKAEFVIHEALAIAHACGLPACAPDLLNRLSYVSLEQEKPQRALREAQEATLAATRLRATADMGRGFLTLSMLRYYNEEYHEGVRDARAALTYLADPTLQLGAHQTAGLCYAALNESARAREHITTAWTLAPSAPTWMHGKLYWLEARFLIGAKRRERLRCAQTHLDRPADRLLVTVELVEDLLAVGETEAAVAEIPRLCTLVEAAAECRQVQRAVSRLVGERSTLSPALIANLQQVLERAQDRQLARIISLEVVEAPPMSRASLHAIRSDR